jgi:hypothetical protein
MKKFILNKATGILKFATAIPYNIAEDEILIETIIDPTFIVNKWNDGEWIEVATAEQIAEFNKPMDLSESEVLLNQFNQLLISLGKEPIRLN